jgi:hypothetical protein
MGNILAQGIFDRVQGDTNRIVIAFCDNIEKEVLKRSDSSLYVFYFLF